MSNIGQREIETQKRVIRHCEDVLGYRYLGHWQDWENNRNVEVGVLSEWLREQNQTVFLIDWDQIDESCSIVARGLVYLT